jgi:hypothetical protein
MVACGTQRPRIGQTSLPNVNGVHDRRAGSGAHISELAVLARRTVRPETTEPIP